MNVDTQTSLVDRTRSLAPWSAFVTCIFLWLTPAITKAQGTGDAPIGKDPSLKPNRTEIIGVPNVGGDSDTGVEGGAAGSLVRFREGYYPYRFRLDAVASMSFKNDRRGFRPVQQYHTTRIDVPQLLSPRLRLDARTDFIRAVNATWFGVGNATTIDPRPPPADADSAYEYVSEHVRLRALVRIKTDTPFELALLTNSRYEFPDPFPTSKLQDDLRARVVVGGKAAFLQTFAAGFMVDTRDHELFPKRGIFYQVGVAGTIGSEEEVRFGEASAVLAHFASLGGPFIFASRMVASFQFGTVPFYELQQGGVFNSQYLLGGARGVRGVRIGRYAGKVKAMTNTELRIAPIPRFKVLHWSVLAGLTTFFDAGRVWSDYSSSPAEDGRTLGLKYGAGGGAFFQWDEANIFRIDVAYSPDETGRSTPLSFYFESGFLF